MPDRMGAGHKYVRIMGERLSKTTKSNRDSVRKCLDHLSIGVNTADSVRFSLRLISTFESD